MRRLRLVGGIKHRLVRVTKFACTALVIALLVLITTVTTPARPGYKHRPVLVEDSPRLLRPACPPALVPQAIAIFDCGKLLVPTGRPALPALRVPAECEWPLVAWDAPIQGGVKTGIASEAVAFLVPLSAWLPVDLVTPPRRQSSFVASLPQDERAIVQRLAQQSLQRVHSPSSVYVSMWDPGEAGRYLRQFVARNAGNEAYRIARVMYEATEIPTGWTEALHEFDEIWAPSAWGRRLLVHSGVPMSKVRVMPEGLDTQTQFNPRAFNKTQARGLIYPPAVRDHFVFLSVAKWENRKAYKELIEAFSREFSQIEKVSLVLRTTPPRPLAQELQDILGDRDLPKNVWLLGHQPDTRYQLMLAGADAFVLASHGEGWGRPIVEAMAMGLPVITTNWSGPTEFITPVTAYILPVTRLTPVQGLPGSPPTAQWAFIDVKQLR